MPDVQETLNRLIELGDEIGAVSEELVLEVGNGTWAHEVAESGHVASVIDSIRQLRAKRDALEAEALELLETLA